MLADIFTQVAGVLADAAGEDYCVNAVHRGNICADELADLIALDASCKSGSLVACLCGGENVSVVARYAGDAENAGLLVEDFSCLCGSPALFLLKIGDSRGINSAAARAHDEAVEGSKTHARVDNLAVLDSGYGRAVAEVAGDELDILEVNTHNFRAASADEAVRCAVEAVAANLVLLVVLIGQREKECLGGAWSNGKRCRKQQLPEHPRRRPRGRHGCPECERRCAGERDRTGSRCRR